MWIIFTALCIIILIIAFLAFHKWRVNVQYKNNKLKIKLGFITIYSSRKKEKSSGWHIKLLDANFSETFKKLKQVKNFFAKEKEGIASILKKMQNTFVVKSLALGITFGFSNAAVTGVANGAIWGLVTAAVSFIDTHIKIKDKTNIALSPVYTEKIFNIAFEITFKMRLFKLYSVAKDAAKLYENYNNAFNKI